MAYWIVTLFMGVMLVHSNRAGNVSEDLELACSVEDVEYANSKQLSSILEELVNTSFFRLYKVELHPKCTIWPQKKRALDDQKLQEQQEKQEKEEQLKEQQHEKQKEQEDTVSCGKLDNEPLGAPLVGGGHCGLDLGNSPFDFPGPSPTSAMIPDSTVDKSLSTDEGERLESISEIDCSEPDEHSPTYWLNLCGDEEESASEYVNLQLNPERWTGYNGSHIWKAIYEENCFVIAGSLQDLCYEEKVLYRLLSGMQTSINIHISLNYYPPSKGKNEGWMPNPQRFIDHYSAKPVFLKNLHFSFVVLLRSLHKVSPYLNYTVSSGDVEEDRYTSLLLKRLMDAPVLKSCGEVFSAFNESLLFKDDEVDSIAWSKGVTMDSRLRDLKKQFKYVFRNITKILDCVTCQRCRLHSKLQLAGIGTALKILLTPEEVLQTISLKREEIVALVNTLGRWSHSINGMKELSKLYQKSIDSMKPLVNKGDSLARMTPSDKYEMPPVAAEAELFSFADLAMKMVSDLYLRGKFSDEQEEALVTSILQGDINILLLAKNYYKFPEKFAKFATLNLANGPRNSILGTTGGKTAKVPAKPKEEVFDAIVVGGGLAGLTTCLTLLDRGARVAILEKEPFFGGNSAWASSGINAVSENIHSPGDSVDIYIKDMTKASGDNQRHIELATLLAKGSGEALEWLRSRLGLKLEQVGQLGGHSFPRTHRPSNGLAGAEIILALDKQLKHDDWKSRLLILKSTKLHRLLVSPSGHVEGIEYVTSSKKGEERGEGGETKRLLANNVVMATGGYAADTSEDSLLKTYTPHLLHLPTTNGRWATGDGHKILIRDVDPSLVDMEKVQVHPTAFVDPSKPDEKTKTLCAEILRGLGGILVDKRGERFSNELGDRLYLFNAMNKTSSDHGDPQLHFTLLLNSKAADTATTHLPLYSRKKLLSRFNDTSQLAGALGIEEAVLLNTFSKYNEAAALGKDEYGKTKFNAVPYTRNTTPYYAGTVTPALHYCMGGVGIDTRGRVLPREGTEPISGLYAAGEITGGIHGNTRLGGNALTECVVFGRLVGNQIEIGKTRENSQTSEPPNASAKNNDEWKTNKISKAQLATRNTQTTCWIAIDNVVYDFTEFAEEHPAGPQVIFDLGGHDGTTEFLEVHNLDMLKQFEPIGVLEE